MVLTEAEGLLMLAAADLETAEASSDPLIFREGAWGLHDQQSWPSSLADSPGGRKDQPWLLAQSLQPLGRASHAVPSMAIPPGPCCQILALVMHVYHDGIKEYGHERHNVPLGSRGNPVKDVRLIPAEKAHALAHNLQVRFAITMKVL